MSFNFLTIKRFGKKGTPLFLCGLIMGVLVIALPSYCINQYAYDNLNRSRDVLLKQLDHVRQTKNDLVLRREQMLNEYKKRIDTLSEYEDQLNSSLREVEDAMK